LFGATSEANAAKTLVVNTKRLEEALKYEGDTMGHCVGGYCPDVLEGRTRIFSLRDKRGEPHVTVEVQPRPIDSWKKLKEVVGPEKGEQLFGEFSQLPGIDAGNAIAKFQEFIQSKGIKSPEIINQIKGKQNLRPIEKYDPYTQDFVKSGNFSDVRDLENTGLFKADPNELGMYLPSADELYAIRDNIFVAGMPALYNANVWSSSQAGNAAATSVVYSFSPFTSTVPKDNTSVPYQEVYAFRSF